MVIFCTYLLCGDVHFSFGILCAFLHYRIFCDMVFNQLYSNPSCGYTIFFTLDWRKVWISNIFNWNTGKGPGVVQKSDSEWKMNIPYFPSPYSLRVATINNLGFPGGASGKEPTCQCRRHKRLRSDPWVGKIPWRGKRQPTPVFLPGESHGQRSLTGYSPWRWESDTTEVTEPSTYPFRDLYACEIHTCMYAYMRNKCLHLCIVYVCIYVLFTKMRASCIIFSAACCMHSAMCHG